MTCVNDAETRRSMTYSVLRNLRFLIIFSDREAHLSREVKSMFWAIAICKALEMDRWICSEASVER
jgi:hypothetical protein